MEILPPTDWSVNEKLDCTVGVTVHVSSLWVLIHFLAPLRANLPYTWSFRTLYLGVELSKSLKNKGLLVKYFENLVKYFKSNELRENDVANGFGR
jgi:hypothetical protein